MMRVVVALAVLWLAGCALNPPPDSSLSDLQPDDAFGRLNRAITGHDDDVSLLFAQALARYRQQPDFHCRHPLYGQYFSRRDAAGRGAVPCNDPIPFSVQAPYAGEQIVWLAPARIRSIHVLFAGKSQGMASRFGHVALRLVVCPTPASSQAECDANLFEHIVIGFRAHIDELSIDTVKALSGKYRAYLFANRFMDVYQDYAINEFREIYSLPLQLDDVDRDNMARALAEIHWRFAGDYRFLTRNCATLLQDALRASWPQYAADTALQRDYLRPDRWFDAMRNSTLAAGEKLQVLPVAEREGYYFSSTRPFYEQAVRTVRDSMQTPAFSSLEQYLRLHPRSRRQFMQQDASFVARLTADPSLREAQIMLEEYSALHAERWLMIEGARYLEHGNFMTQPDALLEKLDASHAPIFDRCLLSEIRQYSAPFARRDAIPLQGEVQSSAGNTAFCLLPDNRRLLNQAIAQLGDSDSAEWLRLKAIGEIWAESLHNVRMLNPAPDLTPHRTPIAATDNTGENI